MQSLKLTNIYSEGRKLYLFHRPDKELCTIIDSSFFPYYYEPSPQGVFKGYRGEKLNKIVCHDPFQIKQKRTVGSMESDLIYSKRYLIDKIKIEKANLRYIFFDIETKSKEMPDPFIAPDPISCITTYDNYTQEYKTFWLLDYKTEYDMLDDFINYIRSIKPDLLIAYNVMGFDFPYLCNRIPDFSIRISPIGKMLRHNNFPAGMGILDYYLMIKKVYKYKKNTLDYVYNETFKKTSTLVKPDFFNLTEEIKQKNKDDVRKMVELEQKLKLIPYFDEMRRLSKVLWEDLCMYSVLVDGFILQIAKEKNIILPTKPDEEEKLRREEDEISGGFVLEPVKGLHENVFLFDCSGTYPSLITTFNLDPANKRIEPNSQTTTIRGIHILQNTNAIVPSVCFRLVNSRKTLQETIEKSINEEEKELLKQKDLAHKALNNTVYGILLFKGSRLYDKDIAGIITYLARFLIRYTKYYLYKNGHKVLASDTDSVFIKTKETKEVIEKMINEEIISRWLKHFGKTQGFIKFKYEGIYDVLYIHTKKHYIGYFTKPDGKRDKIVKGLEMLRSDASKYQEYFQEKLFTKILDKESEINIVNWIKLEIERFKTLSLKEISFPCKLSKSIEEYKVEPIHLRASRYVSEVNPEWKTKLGESYYYCFIISKKQETKIAMRIVKGIKKEVENKVDMNVWAFNDFTNIGDNEIDWNQMLERNIYKKIIDIFEAMNWDLSQVMPIKVKKERKTKEVIPCDFEQCKKNKKGICKAKELVDCPKNNEQSVYENPELLISKIKKDKLIKSISDNLSL